MISVRMLVDGEAGGPLAVLRRPLSLWGGYDVHGGVVMDATHPDAGRSLGGRILAMREARGSSSSSSALVEAARCGTAPAAILLGHVDPILVIGSLVARELYGVTIPIALVDPEDWPRLEDGAAVRLEHGRLAGAGA
ncbi:MAG: DUF126 domain-containing protein [Vicinamibacterales bacterium]